MVYETELMNRYSRGPDGRTGFEEVTGDTPDISEWCDFKFYDLVWFRPHGKLGDADSPADLGLWIGVSHRVGSDMSYWILPKSGHVGSYTTVQHVTKEDHANPKHRESIEEFLQQIKERLNDDHFEIRPEHGTNYLYLDDEMEDPAYPLADAVPDYEDNFPEPEPDEEDAGVDEYLQAADYFVFPSESEGLPLSLIEALACSLPSIATKAGGILDVIQNNQNGMLVSFGDEAELLHAIKSVTEDEDKANLNRQLLN